MTHITRRLGGPRQRSKARQKIKRQAQNATSRLPPTQGWSQKATDHPLRAARLCTRLSCLPHKNSACVSTILPLIGENCLVTPRAQGAWNQPFASPDCHACWWCRELLFVWFRLSIWRPHHSSLLDTEWVCRGENRWVSTDSKTAQEPSCSRHCTTSVPLHPKVTESWSVSCHFKSGKIENLAKHILDWVRMIVIRLLKALHVDVEDLGSNLPSYNWGMVLIDTLK